MNIEYQKLDKHNILELINIDRSDYSDMMYKIEDGELIIVNEIFNHPGLTKNKYDPYIQDLKEILDEGGVVFGAFQGGKLKGISSIDKNFVGKNKDMINLSILWVSKELRKNGIAKKLFELCKNEAKIKNVDKLYISATPSKNTIDFYLKMGCRVTEEIDSDLFNEEPEDIHLELKL
jgi:GNAT superfamily N-acetyltransferase